jgi:SAM-dependent methyltransferase
VTSPPPGAAILDLACGHGRHSLKLARRGFAVAGVDLSEPSLEIARRAASEDDIDITFVHDDMREISFKAEFDVAINMFTAFGYFDEEGDHERALSAARAPSRTTGSSCSTPSIRYGCSAISIPRRSAASTTAPCSSRSVTTTRCAAVLRRRGHSSTRHEQWHSMRLHTLVELRALLERTGLRVIATWGVLSGGAYGMGTNRIVVLARKSLA